MIVFNTEIFLSILSMLLVVIVYCVKRSDDLLVCVINMSAFSLIIAICYTLMDAVDVAMTEVALNACLSTIIFINLIKKMQNKRENCLLYRYRKVNKYVYFLLSISFLNVIYNCLDIVNFGEESFIHKNISKYYVDNTEKEIGIPSFVASILADYRGYDTLGETSVILIAIICVLVILYKK